MNYGTYTILFTDAQLRTAGIVVIDYQNGASSPSIIRHAHENDKYERAFMLTREGFEQDPFYVRKEGQENREVETALAILQELIDDENA